MGGVVDQDIVEKEKEAMKEFDIDEEAMTAQMVAMTDEEYGVAINGMMEGMCASLFNSPEYLEAEESCDHSTLGVPTTHDGDYEVQVLVHTPKAIAQEDSRACIIYAHGGGAIAGSATMHKGFLSHRAVDCGVVVFNVYYRLAPGTRCPNNVLDFYEVIKYVSLHAKDLSIDSSRIAIAGESGGGYICAGAMVQLARQDEGHLVKLAVPIIPMLSDYSFSDTAGMTKEEAENAVGQQKIWRLIAGPGMEAMKQDALLFPGKADELTLSKMPPTIVWDAEFDFYITEACRFASRLRAAGRLLELVIIPGAKHGSGMSPINGCFKMEREAWRLAIQEYLLK